MDKNIGSNFCDIYITSNIRRVSSIIQVIITRKKKLTWIFFINDDVCYCLEMKNSCDYSLADLFCGYKLQHILNRISNHFSTFVLHVAVV